MKIVLASASPRRREIFGALGVPVVVMPSAVDEVLDPAETPLDAVRRLARAKAEDVATRPEMANDSLVLGADTIVVVAGEILGKPADDRDATRMLALLAGSANRTDRWHDVITAVALAGAGSGVLEDLAVTTRVRFVSMSDARIAQYVATGEGWDKAGAYAVQGLGAAWIERIEGSYSNVVGLPAAETIALLDRHGALVGWPPSAA